MAVTVKSYAGPDRQIQTPPLTEVVTRNVRAELARANIDAGLVADALDVSRDSVNRRLSGKQKWQLDELDIVASLAGVDRERLFTT